MRVPKRIVDLLNKKQAFIDSNRDKLERSVARMQTKYLDQLLAKIIPELDVKDGLITDSTHNYRLLADLDKVYKDFTKVSTSVIGAQFVSTTAGIGELGRKYFSLVLNTDLITRFDKVIDATINKMNLRIGINGEGTIKSGFLDTIIKDTSINTQGIT